MATRAIQTVEQGGAVARIDNDFTRLDRQLASRADEFAKALPSHITPAKLQRTIMTAAQANPELLAADRGTLITAAMKAAQDGLLPDGREAALVIFSTRQKQGSQWVSVKQVQYMPMVFGLRKKILQSGEISSIETNVVYRAELESGSFLYEAGTEAMLRHRPMLELSDEDVTDDKIVAAYSVAVMKDGSKSFEVMRRSEINKVRQASQTGALGKTKYNSSDPIPPKGPWVDWFAEMARKTVMRRHSKTLPMSGDLLLDVEGAEQDRAARSAQELLNRVEPDAPAALPPTRDEVAAQDEPAHDPETGETTDESDEETARRLDEETFAAREGRADEDHGDQHDGDPADDESASERMARTLIERCEAGVKTDLPNIERDLVQQMDAMEPDQVKRVEAAIGALRRRTR